MNIVTISNLYPGVARPTHGVFVEERMSRYAARFGSHLRVVSPVPWFPFRKGFGEYSQFASTPRRETRRGIEIFHPRVVVIPKFGMRFAPALFATACRGLLQQLHRERPIDVLDAHYLYPDAVAAARLGRELKIPVVVSARGSDVNVIAQLPGPAAQIREACGSACAVIAVSAALGAKLQQLGVDPGKIHIISNGVNVDAFAPPPELTRNAVPRMITGVGRLVETKGWRLAIGAVANLKNQFPDIQLQIIGAGPARDALMECARVRGVADRVTLPGETTHDAIPAILWKSDRFILPSHREGHPNVVVEAIAAGLPVVATAVGGIPEIVEDRFGDLAADVTEESVTAALRRSLSRTFDAGDFERHRQSLRWEHALDRLHQIFAAVAPGPQVAASAAKPYNSTRL